MYMLNLIIDCPTVQHSSKWTVIKLLIEKRVQGDFFSNPVDGVILSLIFSLTFYMIVKIKFIVNFDT